ncbi:hypothetical protein ACXYTJ_14130 [Gilvimarinus sp. F26214L]|uniref:hypothetical protein n=1 Tax=Gilvimarinus sp. DZF01 TaxID=3461371 RepID=UPI0040452B36
MKIKTMISISVLAATLVGCGSDDGITLAPTTVTNPPANSGGGNDNNDGGTSGDYTGPCAYYAEGDAVVHGQFDQESGNCEYLSAFVGEANPLSEGTMFVPALDNGGVHLFHDSLFIGSDVTEADAQGGTPVPQEGEGAKVEIEGGALIAFTSSDDYVRVARGSQIFAEGSAEAPIIFSGEKDLVDGAANEGDRGLWGGVQINGNGQTNKCTLAEISDNNCHVTAEGKPATYGGNNNEESSGVMRYVQIRHAGFEVVDGDELNGLTLNGVGSGTTIEYVQTYTTQDDGFEMFGGAVNLKNVVAVNVGDDSLDFSEGWQGNVQYALIVHTSGSNRCIEADNNGSDNAKQPFTKGRVSNMTCITSNVAQDEGTFATSKGSSEGVLFREGAFFELYNSVITSNADAMASHECVEINQPLTAQGVESDGYSVARSNVVACGEPFKFDSADSPTFDIAAWWTTDNVNANLPATVIDGLSSSAPTAYVTAASMSDADGSIAVIPYDVSQLQDSFAPDAAPAEGSGGSSSFFEAVDFIGAISADDDWVAGWTTGL